MVRLKIIEYELTKESKVSVSENIEKFRTLIKDVKFAMLTTVGAEGQLQSCPMTTQQSEYDGYLWFFISKSGHKMAEIRRQPTVNLSYAKPEDHVYVSVSGRAELIDDREKAEELWSPVYKAWFKEGLEDPDLGLLRIEIEKAEYWDSPSSGVAHVIGLAKSLLTGKSPSKLGDHEKINLQ